MQIGKYKNFEYVIRYPDNFDTEAKYPVVMCLHGAGGREMPIENVKTFSHFKLTKDFGLPMVMVAPLCFADTWFEIFEQLQDFVRFVSGLPFVDPDRFCLMGGSMGGYATWQLGMTMPEYFSALVPICGGGMYWNAARLKNVPVWAFHGSEDPTVFANESVKMVNAVNKRGGNAKLSMLDGVGHDSWTAAYGSREVFEWALSKTRYKGD